MNTILTISGSFFQMESGLLRKQEDFAWGEDDNCFCHKPPTVVQTICRGDDGADLFGVQFLQGNDRICRDAIFGDVVTADARWERVQYYPAKNPNPSCAVILAAVCSRLAFENTVLCHGSLVEYKGRGILFIGKSGAGKTTQAELWQKSKGADIINGDKVFLHLKNGTVFGCGSPWHGSSSYCLNKTVPLAGIVSLEKSPELHLEKLSDFQKNQHLLSHLFLPHWDKACLNFALETADAILQNENLPLFRMACPPDESAVNGVAEVLGL